VRERLVELNPVLQAVYAHEPLAAKPVADEVLQYAPALQPFVTDTSAYLNEALAAGRPLLFEGAQGSLLDIDHGTYPFVTSSNATAGGAATGSGVSPKLLQTIIGVAKAYTTRVGSGPFPTELKEEIGTRLRERGAEFGTTTGRPRRCGWFDAVAARYAVQVSGADSVALTKLDVLTGESRIRVCTSYEVDGKLVQRFPADAAQVERAVPVYETLAGWREPLDDIRDFEQLPRPARTYVQRIEQLLGTPIRYLGVGKTRDALIHR
jgi:adenylosuccinate synthase